MRTPHWGQKLQMWTSMPRAPSMWLVGNRSWLSMMQNRSEHSETIPSNSMKPLSGIDHFRPTTVSSSASRSMSAAEMSRLVQWVLYTTSPTPEAAAAAATCSWKSSSVWAK